MTFIPSFVALVVSRRLETMNYSRRTKSDVEVDRWIADIKNVSPVILQAQKMSFNNHDHFREPELTPMQQYIPDYVASDECRERRMAFIERRKIDPSKNLPYAKIPIG